MIKNRPKNHILRDFTFLTGSLSKSYTLVAEFSKFYDFETNFTLAQKALDSVKSLYNKEKFGEQNNLITLRVSLIYKDRLMLFGSGFKWQNTGA